MTRVFEHTRLWTISVPAYRAAARLLAEAVADRIAKGGTVIGIAEGGRAPAYAIARHLGLPVVIVSAKHNDTDAVYAPATGTVSCDLAGLVPVRPPEPIILVDDICGSGATLATVAEHLGSPLTMTLCRNEGAPAGMPDLYVWPVADWVVFPWEPQPRLATTYLPTPQKVRTA